MAKFAEHKVGTIGSAEYWLVPHGDNRIHKKFEIRKSKKEVPSSLSGMYITLADGIKAFNSHVAQSILDKKHGKS